MANNLDALLKTVIGSFNQPETKAITWATALKECFITSQSQLTDLLKVDRTEKEAGRGGSSAWRVVIGALAQADIGEAAWPVIEAKLTELLDKCAAGKAKVAVPSGSSGTPPVPLRPLKLFDTSPLPWPGKLLSAPDTTSTRAREHPPQDQTSSVRGGD